MIFLGGGGGGGDEKEKGNCVSGRTVIILIKLSYHQVYRER